MICTEEKERCHVCGYSAHQFESKDEKGYKCIWCAQEEFKVQLKEEKTARAILDKGW